MIRRAKFIAIVEFVDAEGSIFKIPATIPKGRQPDRFTRQVTVRVVENLKGELPAEAKIHDGLGRWDVLFQNHADSVKSNEGRFLVFLIGDTRFLTGVNGWASSARIVDDRIEWEAKDNHPRFQLVSLSEILSRLRKQLAEK